MSHDINHPAGRRAVLGDLRRYPAAAFIVINVGFSLLTVFLCSAISLDPGQAAVLTLPVVFSPLVTALWLTHHAEGADAARALANKFLDWRAPPLWYVVALGIFPLLAGVALLVRWLWLDIPPQTRVDFAWNEALPLALFLFLFPGVTEELGWRGFLQPRLQRQVNGLVASLGVGLTWGLWHARSLVTEPDKYTAESYGLFLEMTVGCAVVIGWIWNHSRGSVPLAMLAHFGANVTFTFFPMGSPEPGDNRIWWIYTGVIWAAVLLLVALQGPSLRGWRSRSGDNNPDPPV